MKIYSVFKSNLKSLSIKKQSLKKLSVQSKPGVSLIFGLSLLLFVSCTPKSDKQNAFHSEQADLLDLTKETPFNIINGQRVNQSEDDYSNSIVALLDTESGGLCTGSIISSQYILTAAHCMPNNPQKLVVLFGEDVDVAYEKGNYIPVAKSAIHPQYRKIMIDAKQNNKFSNHNWGDIALIKIDRDLPANYKPISLVSIDSRSYRQETTLAGYGLFNGVNNTGSGLLRKTIVSIENPSYSQTEASLDQTRGTGACRGDSGGPAYIKTSQGYALWGITSRGLNDIKLDCSQYSIYTKVVAFKDWIIQARLFLARP